jgi:hypothetical protein
VVTRQHTFIRFACCIVWRGDMDHYIYSMFDFSKEFVNLPDCGRKGEVNCAQVA